MCACPGHAPPPAPSPTLQPAARRGRRLFFIYIYIHRFPSSFYRNYFVSVAIISIMLSKQACDWVPCSLYKRCLFIWPPAYYLIKHTNRSIHDLRSFSLHDCKLVTLGASLVAVMATFIASAAYGRRREAYDAFVVKLPTAYSVLHVLVRRTLLVPAYHG